MAGEETQSALLTNEPSSTETSTMWYSDENKELVSQQGWKDPNEVIRDYGQLQKSSSAKVKIPTPESSAEEISGFYAKIRGVDTPDGYEIQVPENVPMDEGLLTKLRQWAFDAGAPKVAFDTVMKNWLQEMSDQRTQSLESAKKELQEEWKEDYDVNFEMADRFVTNDCSQPFRELIVELGLNNNPVFVREFLALSKKTATDKLIQGETKDGGNEKENWKPAYPDSPEMYRNGDDEDSRRAREWFKVNKGFQY
jgi:hypothetical protein